MALSTDLISQFVKVTNDKDTKSRASTITGTVVVRDNNAYVKMDGSDQLTPVSTTTELKHGDRVTVTIKDHVATATGNTTSPAARVDSVTEKDTEVKQSVIGEFNRVIADYATIENLQATHANISELVAEKATVTDLEATNAKVGTLEADNATLKNLVAEKATVTDLEAATARIGTLEAEKATITDLEATNAKVGTLEVDSATVKEAVIGDLTAEDGSITNLSAKYATIDFANIGEAAMEYFYAESGLIENVKVGDQTIAGELVGVTIRGDRIIGNTIMADKLVIRGTDGLYYKLNTRGVSHTGATEERIEYVENGEIELPADGTLVDGVVTNEGRPVYQYVDGDVTKYYSTSEGDSKYYEVFAETNVVQLEQTIENSLDGSIITAHTITATQITVKDLVAFDAKIGGFVIDGDDENEAALGSIHTVGKSSVDNSTEGIYMDSSGQMNVGGSTNFIKYVKNDDGSYSLAISAESIEFAITDQNGNPTGETRSLSSLGNLGEYVRITTLDGEPCIELGEFDSDFKLYITNTRILFAQGTVYPAWITNQSLHIDKAVVENELQFGQFVWQKRENGNMGIVWVDEGVDE